MSGFHTLNNPLPHDRSEFFLSDTYWKAVENFFATELKNDGADITAQFFLEEKKNISAHIIAKQEGVLAGKEELTFFLEKFFPSIQFSWKVEEGKRFEKLQEIVLLKGNAQEIMKLERVFLNVLSRLSGIATQTNFLTTNSPLPIAATRKTQWSFLDKKAVFVGGGLTHRMGLFDSMMIKENHLLAMKNNLEECLEKFFKNFLDLKMLLKNKQKFFEIEVETEEEFEKVFQVFFREEFLDLPKVIMLDNFSPEKIKNLLKKFPAQDERQQKNIFLEASGGISEKNFLEYENCGVDVLSMGALTNNVSPIDFSLRVK
jgi:nicotinate-nucleotide pyrophosphorylase (carboxylating)